MCRLNVVFVLSIALLQNCAQSSEAELKSVVVLFRHGDRGPVSFYPTEPYDESYWPFGRSELTNIGKNQMYVLGQWIRNRYSRFLSRRYSTSEIQVQSFNKNRCLMSAAVTLAGLYPPVDDQVWNRNLPWQPIPIQTTPDAYEPFLTKGQECPKYINLYKKLMATKQFKEIYRQNVELFKYLTKHTGRPIVTIDDLSIIYDTLLTETFHNLTLPKWAQKILSMKDGQFKKLYDLCWSNYSNTTDLARLSTGPLVDAITSHLENVVSGNRSAPKLLMWSVLDATIANILNTLHIFDNLAPPYGATVMLELRESRGNHFLNVFYKKFDTIKQLALPRCGFNCDFNFFRRFVRPVRINLSNWRAECHQEEVRRTRNHYAKLRFVSSKRIIRIG